MLLVTRADAGSSVNNSNNALGGNNGLRKHVAKQLVAVLA